MGSAVVGEWLSEAFVGECWWERRLDAHLQKAAAG